ncbi:MAG: hypothetical protein K8F25_03155, partial [Fimbriimonadaceae bacterium]|nr:hypothetical protein [Alphaproteobacteria bacterium]
HKGQQTQTPHPKQHQHDHARGFPLRALLIGLMHGMAGSAALILLTLNAVTAPGWGLVYIAVFGIGSISGMAVISFVLAFPIKKARSMTALHNAVQGLIGGGTVLLGFFTMTSVGLF